MIFGDSLHYLAIGNPVSRSIIGLTASVLGRNSATASHAKVQSVLPPPLWKLAGPNHNFVRIAGLSGALAVVLAAAGSHRLNTVSDKVETKTIFETANRFHFFHSLALMGVPLAKYPVLTGILMINGTLLFSGILYYRAFTGDKRFSHYAPLGGACLILAWLTLLL